MSPLHKLPERKKFVPNLNVQRQLKKESDEPEKSEPKWKRRKENKHERRERNNGKIKQWIITV